MATGDQQPAGTDQQKKPPARPITEIQADLDQTRSRLAGNIDELRAQTSPQAVKERAEGKAKEAVATVQGKAKAALTNPDGSVRTERVLAIGGGIVALLLVRRGFKARARRKELARLAQVVWVPVPRSAVNAEYADMARNARELAPAALDYHPQLELASS